MTTSLPTQSPTFTPEQRRMLGQVYNLILSWRNEKRKLETISSQTVKPNVYEITQPVCDQNGGSDD
jgi:hypothetical protein